jgi:hypothetical protein
MVGVLQQKEVTGSGARCSLINNLRRGILVHKPTSDHPSHLRRAVRGGISRPMRYAALNDPTGMHALALSPTAGAANRHGLDLIEIHYATRLPGRPTFATSTPGVACDQRA